MITTSQKARLCEMAQQLKPMPITRKLLSKKLKKGTNGIYWLMEQFYMHDDDYKLILSKPFATL